MITRIVLDASVALAWVLGDRDSFARAERVLHAAKTSRLLVPALWQSEVANVLLVKERQLRIDESRAKQCLRLLENLPIEIDLASASTTFDHVLPLARRHELSAYDGAYLELAIRENAPLATFDEALRRAAGREGVETFGDS